MSEEDGLIWAFDVDASGRGREIEWDGLANPIQDGYRWVHLELDAPDARTWLREESGLDEVECEALLADETRPRATPVGTGVILILRGVNQNPGADPEDMVSVRLWVDGNRILSVRRHRLLAVDDLRSQLVSGHGPSNAGAFVAELADRLVERMSGVLGDLHENLDAIESDLEDQPLGDARSALIGFRRQAILLRRYLAPQREALARLVSERFAWLDDRERLLLREVLDRTTRYVEDLEAARERAAVAQEEIANRLSEQLNARMYALSVIAGIFLPLSFLTGLLGINVGGMPGVDDPRAFTFVCVGLAVLGVAAVWLFRRLRWI